MLYDGKQDGQQAVSIGQGKTVQRGGTTASKVPQPNALVIIFVVLLSILLDSPYVPSPIIGFVLKWDMG